MHIYRGNAHWQECIFASILPPIPISLLKYTHTTICTYALTLGWPSRINLWMTCRNFQHTMGLAWTGILDPIVQNMVPPLSWNVPRIASFVQLKKMNGCSTVTTSSPQEYINWQTALNNGSTFHLTFYQWQSDCQKPFQKLFNHNHLTYIHVYKSTSKTMFELYMQHVLYMCTEYHI